MIIHQLLQSSECFVGVFLHFCAILLNLPVFINTLKDSPSLGKVIFPSARRRCRSVLQSCSILSVMLEIKCKSCRQTKEDWSTKVKRMSLEANYCAGFSWKRVNFPCIVLCFGFVTPALVIVEYLVQLLSHIRGLVLSVPPNVLQVLVF